MSQSPLHGNIKSRTKGLSKLKIRAKRFPEKDWVNFHTVLNRRLPLFFQALKVCTGWFCLLTNERLWAAIYVRDTGLLSVPVNGPRLLLESLYQQEQARWIFFPGKYHNDDVDFFEPTMKMFCFNIFASLLAKMFKAPDKFQGMQSCNPR